MNEKGIRTINDASTCEGVTEHHNCMPITPFSSSIQTPAGAAGTASTIRNRNISREEIITSENAQSSALNDYEIHRPKPQTCTEYFGAQFVRNPDGEKSKMSLVRSFIHSSAFFTIRRNLTDF